MSRGLRVPSTRVNHGLAKRRLYVKTNSVSITVRQGAREISTLLPILSLLGLVRGRMSLTTSLLNTFNSLIIRHLHNLRIEMTRVLGISNSGLHQTSTKLHRFLLSRLRRSQLSTTTGANRSFGRLYSRGEASATRVRFTFSRGA